MSLEITTKCFVTLLIPFLILCAFFFFFFIHSILAPAFIPSLLAAPNLIIVQNTINEAIEVPCCTFGALFIWTGITWRDFFYVLCLFSFFLFLEKRNNEKIKQINNNNCNIHLIGRTSWFRMNTKYFFFIHFKFPPTL